MEIIIQDTRKLYKELLTLEDSKRNKFYYEELIAPFKSAFELAQMPVSPETLGFMPIIGKDKETKEMLDTLEKAQVWDIAKNTMLESVKHFEEAGVPVPDRVIVSIFIGNPETLAMTDGYTGMGSFPGYIQIMIAPNETNLPKLKACIAHEFHHNVFFYNATWNFMNVTLGQYLAVEGLAESFASALYGDEFIGPWVTSVTGDNLEKARKIIAANLGVQGFFEVRKYIYGEHPMVPEAKDLGVPFCGGYAVGYHAVQAYIKKTGTSVEKATLVDGNEIMKASGYFLD